MAKQFVKNGYPTYASARSLESIQDLSSLGCETLRIDVTDDLSIQEAVRTIEKKHAAVGILVNNAAIGKELMAGVHKVANDSIQEGAPGTWTPEKVANVTYKAATSIKPKVRYRPGMVSKALIYSRYLLPYRMWDSMFVNTLTKQGRKFLAVKQ